MVGNTSRHPGFSNGITPLSATESGVDANNHKHFWLIMMSSICVVVVVVVVVNLQRIITASPSPLGRSAGGRQLHPKLQN